MGLWLALAVGAYASAWAADPIDEIRHIEWRREAPTALDPFVDDESPDVRAQAAVALGRLQSADALSRLVTLAGDSDPTVREAAADALGYTPGGLSELRKLLIGSTVPAGWGAGAATERAWRSSLVRGLGRQGTAEDVPTLIGALAEPWPTGGAAVEALVRMKRREIDVDAAIPSLVASLDRLDPRACEIAAFGLRRIGMEKASAADVAVVTRRWSELPTAAARGWALRAVWGRLPAERKAAVFAKAMGDTDVSLKVSALDAVQKGDIAFPLIAPWLEDRHPWVRSAATAAAGRLGGDNARVVLSTREAGADPWEAADAMAARIAAGESAAASEAIDVGRPSAVRAAAIEGLTDPAVLLMLTNDVAPMVRSSAAMALAELGPTKVSVESCLAMLRSDDLVVRQASLELLTAHDERVGAAGVPLLPIVQQLRVDLDPDVMQTGLNLLLERARRRPKDFDAIDRVLLQATIDRAGADPDATVRVPAEAVRERLHLAASGLAVRTDIVLPDLADVERIRSARVVTNRGEFRIDLRPDLAPLAVWNFATLADRDFFDGVIFHRVVPGFVVQTGDPRADGSGGPGYTVPDEVTSTTYSEGAVGLARSSAFDTGGSQWFVAVEPQPHLDGDYTLFGTVGDGMHVVKAIRRGDRVLDVIIERTAAP